METTLFDYHLPPEKIAQHPIEPRDASRLLVIKAQSKKHKAKSDGFDEIIFRDITSMLRKGDTIVINDTRVMPARIKGFTILQGNRKKEKEQKSKDYKNNIPHSFSFSLFSSVPGAKVVECLFLRNTAPDIWEIMCFPGERLKTGRQIILENGMVLDVVGETYAGRLVKVPVPHHEWLEVLLKYGEVPLPPYITEHLANSELYQTVYAENMGSTAAPTAGRHFTPELLEKIRSMGVDIVPVTLHIGPGTFKPIYEEDITSYQIHTEFVTIPAETIQKLEEAKKRGGRVIAVGTTSMRSLESFAANKLQPISQNHKAQSTKQKDGFVDDCGNGNKGGNELNRLNVGNGYSGDTNLYITPGYEFQMVDVLVTNFHAPRTSLLVLVAAFMGFETMIQAYQYALDHDFRFLSFGDAMWVEKSYLTFA